MAKDLIDEDGIAETIYADYLARNPDLDVGRDSFLGTKSRALAKEAGELAAVTALQAVGVPWWLTTGVNAFGKEAENAAREGADFDDAARSGLISAGAEIFTEAISKGLKDGGWSVSEKAAQKISTFISDDFINSAIRFGVKSVEGVQKMQLFGRWKSSDNGLAIKMKKLLERCSRRMMQERNYQWHFGVGWCWKACRKQLTQLLGKKILWIRCMMGVGDTTRLIYPHITKTGIFSFFKKQKGRQSLPLNI